MDKVVVPPLSIEPLTITTSYDKLRTISLPPRCRHTCSLGLDRENTTVGEPGWQNLDLVRHAIWLSLCFSSIPSDPNFEEGNEGEMNSMS